MQMAMVALVCLAVGAFFGLIVGAMCFAAERGDE